LNDKTTVKKLKRRLSTARLPTWHRPWPRLPNSITWQSCCGRFRRRTT